MYCFTIYVSHWRFWCFCLRWFPTFGCQSPWQHQNLQCDTQIVRQYIISTIYTWLKSSGTYLIKNGRYASNQKCQIRIWWKLCIMCEFVISVYKTWCRKFIVDNIRVFQSYFFFFFENYLGVTRKYSTFRFPDISSGQKYYLGGTRK